MIVDLENELREVFTARAAELPPEEAPYPETVRRIGRARRQRRLLTVSGVVAAGVVAASVTVLAETSAEAPFGDAAATVRNEPPPRPDQYVVVHTKRWGLFFSERTPDRTETQERLDWTRVDGRGPGLARSGGRSTWVCDRGVGEALLRADVVGPPARCTTNRGYRTDLPTGIGAMRRFLTRASGDLRGADAALERVSEMLTINAVPARSRVAMLRALVSVRGFSRVPGTVELAGRRGVAVGLVRFGVRTDLVFDQTTFAFLGTRDVLAKQDGAKPAGTVTETVQVRTQIVDRVGELPKG